MKYLTGYLPVLVMLVAQPALASDKHPERTSRDRYAARFAAEVEHHSWRISTFATRPNCPLLCVNHGDHDGLRILMKGGTVEEVDRFAYEELKPRMAEMQALGFVEIDILELQPSHSYPNGTVRIPIPFHTKD